MNKLDNFVLPFPNVLRVEPASACNFKCIHCPTGLDMNKSLGIMSWDTFKKILEKIKKHRFRVIVLYHGGEPLLNRNFCRMVKELRPLAERVKTVTNGSRLSDDLIEQILESGLDIIEFSLDGTTPEENDQIRINCRFEQVAGGIRRLINRRNALDLKTPRVFIANTQIPKTLKDAQRPIAVPGYLKEAFRDIEDDIEYKLTYSLIWAGMPFPHQDLHPDSNFCDHVVNTFTIRWNGDVVPCCYDLVNKMVMGNVLKEELEEIWNNQKYLRLRKAIHDFTPPDLCRGCLVLYSRAYMLKKHLT